MPSGILGTRLADRPVASGARHRVAWLAAASMYGMLHGMEKGSSGFRVGGMSWRIAGTPAQSRRYAPPSLRYGLR
jgi:hypothetical protein